MLNNTMKRCLSLVLALVMVFSLLPVSTIAEETEPTETQAAETDPTVTSQPEESSEPTGETEESSEPTGEASEPTVGTGLPDGPQTTDPTGASEDATDPTKETEAEDTLSALQAEMDDILLTYLGATVLTEEEVIDIVNTMLWDDMEKALDRCNALEPQISALTEEEISWLEENYAGTDTIVCFYETLQLAMTPGFYAASGTHTPVTGVTVGVSGATDNSMSGGAVTVTAKGSAGVFGIGANAKTATIKVSNSGTEEATVAFDWTASSVNQLTIDGTTYSGTSGSFSKTLGANGSFTITVTTAKNSTTNKLVMSNFSWTAASASFSVTLQYDSNAGSVTVDGNTVSSGSSVDVPSTGAAFKATGNFVAWIDSSTKKILSTDNPYTLTPSSDMTIKAVITSEACFQSTDNILYENLQAAIASGKTQITLFNNGTLSAGDYTIPAGVTLLIPMSAAHKVYTTQPEMVTGDNYWSSPAAITSYRKLTMAAGASIIVEEKGAISIAGTHKAGGLYAANNSGAAGFIAMNANSSITVNSGGFLYAWGFITGSGNVTIKSGGTVYENFQVCDWRGGDVTMQMNNSASEYGVFPMSQYYVQNVEVPMKLEAGAIEETLMSVDITLLGIQKAPISFIGSEDAMFHISSGYAIKDYSESEDRMVITMYPDSATGKGELSISPTSITLYLGGWGNTTMATKNYELPLTNNLRVTAKSGTTITISQDVAVLPGAEIIIDSSATCKLGSGVSIYLYDLDQWGGYCGAGNSQMIVLPNAPGRTGSRSALVDALLKINGTLDASEGYIYTTVGGANICSDGSGVIKTQAGTQTVTYQVTQADSLTYNEISITPAKLKNSDGTFLQSAAGTYKYINGFWHLGESCSGGTATCTKQATCDYCGKGYGNLAAHTEVIDAAVAATCTETGLTEGKHCSVCNTVLVAQETVDALGHTEVVDAAVAATCTTTGLTEGKHCSVCNTVLVAQTEVPKLAHTAGEVVVEKNVDATCTADGSYDNVTYCTVCDAELSRATVTVDALGHSYDDGVVTTAPTCTATGVKTFTCTTCGDSYTEEIPATGHNFVDGTCACGEKAPIAIAHSMQAFLLLKSEVIMGVGFTLENLGNIDPTSLEDSVGLLMWYTDEAPDDDKLTKENCTNICSANYNTDEQRFEAFSQGIPAKDLGRARTFRAYYIDDQGNYVYGRIIKEYSPKTYCYNKLNPAKDLETDNDAVMIAILNYCTAAQEFFHYDENYEYQMDTPINKDLTAEQKTLSWDGTLVRSDWAVPTAKEGDLTRNKTVITSRGANLTLKGAINYTYYFAVSDIVVAEAKILTWTEAAYNSADVLTENNAVVYDLEYDEDYSRYEYTYNGLPAKDMFSPIYACAKITDTEGNVYYSGVIAYCPERYSYIHQNDTNTYSAALAKWIVIYGDAARTYFKNE